MNKKITGILFVIILIFLVTACSDAITDATQNADSYIEQNHIDKGIYIPRIIGYTAQRANSSSSIQVPIIAVYHDNINFDMRSVYLCDESNQYPCSIEFLQGDGGANYMLTTMILTPAGLAEGIHNMDTLRVTIGDSELMYDIGTLIFDIRENAFEIFDTAPPIELQGTTTSMISAVPYYSLQMINHTDNDVQLNSIDFGAADSFSNYKITSSNTEDGEYTEIKSVKAGEHRYFKIEFFNGEKINEEFLNVTPFVNLSDHNNNLASYIPFEARYWPDMDDKRIIDIINNGAGEKVDF